MFYPEEEDMAVQKIIIAIDGYSSCGKSTTAKHVAANLGYGYIDTGAMYRAVTLYFLENSITFTNPKEVEKALQNILISFHHNSVKVYLQLVNIRFVAGQPSSW